MIQRNRILTVSLFAAAWLVVDSSSAAAQAAAMPSSGTPAHEGHVMDHATPAAPTLVPAVPADLPRERVGTVVIAHGGGADWNQPVLEAARNADTGGPVEVSFLMGDSAHVYRFQDAVASLAAQGAEHVVVVPLLASSHSSHYEQIRWLVGGTDEISDVMLHHLHMAGIERPATSIPLTLTPALDASPEIADVLTERAAKLATSPGEQALFIVGHGPNGAVDYAHWMVNLRPIAEDVGRRGGFRDVRLGMVRHDAPEPVRSEAVTRIREIITLQYELTGQDVVVVPILISKGYVSVRKLPQDLAGLPVVYDGEGLLPHSALSRWIERRVSERVATY